MIGDDSTGNPIEDILMLMRIRRKIDNRVEPRLFKLVISIHRILLQLTLSYFYIILDIVLF